MPTHIFAMQVSSRVYQTVNRGCLRSVCALCMTFLEPKNLDAQPSKPHTPQMLQR